MSASIVEAAKVLVFPDQKPRFETLPREDPLFLVAEAPDSW